MRKALKDLNRGKPVLVHDSGDREDEVDMIYAAEAVGSEDVARLRNDAGGLICVAVHPEASRSLGLPYMEDALSELGDTVDDRLIDADLEYDDRCSFSLWVNHRSTRTGITDKDRSKTIRRLADATEAVLSGGLFDLASEFRSPGHVAVLRAHEELLDGRRGHTEMGVALALEAGVTPAAVVCEMLDGETGTALSVEDAREYASDNGLTVLKGEELIQAVH